MTPRIWAAATAAASPIPGTSPTTRANRSSGSTTTSNQEPPGSTASSGTQKRP